jgi:hypothetical protein
MATNAKFDWVTITRILVSRVGSNTKVTSQPKMAALWNDFTDTVLTANAHKGAAKFTQADFAPIMLDIEILAETQDLIDSRTSSAINGDTMRSAASVSTLSPTMTYPTPSLVQRDYGHSVMTTTLTDQHHFHVCATESTASASPCERCRSPVKPYDWYCSECKHVQSSGWVCQPCGLVCSTNSPDCPRRINGCPGFKLGSPPVITTPGGSHDIMARRAVKARDDIRTTRETRKKQQNRHSGSDHGGRSNRHTPSPSRDQSSDSEERPSVRFPLFGHGTYGGPTPYGDAQSSGRDFVDRSDGGQEHLNKGFSRTTR